MKHQEEANEIRKVIILKHQDHKVKERGAFMVLQRKLHHLKITR